ncbi:MAG: hypothetical protein AAF927_22535 [Bacteroidota bacterium]
MNRFLLIFSLSLLFVLSAQKVQAQIVPDTLIYVTSPSKFYESGDLNNLKGDFASFGLPDLRQMTTLSTSKTKQLKVPAKSKGSTGAVAIRNKNKCFKVSGPKGKQGTIVWWDRNKDGKIQPLRELRCISPQGKGLKVFVEEISCK